jgi:outer membrane protein OmpU
MKKVLFATTALVATAGMAAADVSFGGFGRFGMIYKDADGSDSTTHIEQRFRLTVTGTATSDNGLEFEGRIRIEHSSKLRSWFRSLHRRLPLGRGPRV